jgi:hypothetical protein
VRLLIAAGEDPNAAAGDTTPLMAARDEGIAAVLLEAGADVNGVGRDGRTALVCACFRDPDRVKFLLKAGADKEKTGGIFTPLTAVLYDDVADETRAAILPLLIAAGVDVNRADGTGETPLHYSVQLELEAAVATLLKGGADPNRANKRGVTPLSKACGSGWCNAVIVEAMLKAGADPRGTDAKGRTPLHRAAKHDHSALVEILRVHGADIDARDHRGNTPLITAIEHNKYVTANVLIEKGADVHAGNSSGITPIEAACRAGNTPMARMLIKRGVATGRALLAASAAGEPEMIDMLLRSWVDKDVKSDRGCTPMNLAAFHGHAAVVKLLLAAGADKNLANDSGTLPIAAAAKNGHKEIVAMLR